MMGAMIMLLILIAWDIREQAISPAAAAIPTITLEEAEELQRKITWQAEEADFFAEQFAVTKEQAEEELADLQARLALAERETQRVREELDRLAQLAQQFDTQTSATPEEVEHLQRLLTQQQQRRAEAELELAKLREEASRMEKSYAIIPPRRPDGTFRRPIYIECRGNRVIIQPEGIELVPGDFQFLGEPANPFDTVLRTIREYYIETGQIVRGSEPYPLLIVRPSGVEMFSKAMHATGNWVRDFGYEIVSEDWNIQYPEPDEELRRRVQQQLEIARNRLSSYLIAQRMAEQRSGFSGGNTPQFSIDHRGNVVPLGGLRSSEEAQRHLEANRQVIGQQADWMSISAEMIDREERLIRQDEAQIRQMQPMQQQPPMQQSQQMQQQPQNLSEQPGMNVTVGVHGMPPNQRPQNWALQGMTQFTREISRYVHIRCEANRFVLSVQTGLTTEQEIPITGSVVTAADQLVQAIWDLQNSWDSAGENVHWRPILRIRVSPGGEQRVRELQTLLRNSGLEIEVL